MIADARRLASVFPHVDLKIRKKSRRLRLKKTKRPLVLTVHGKAELVVQDANSYQHMLERLDELEAVEAINQGLKDVEEGRVHDAREALEGLRVKLGISR